MNRLWQRQGLLGLVIFPAVAQPTVPPLEEQLLDERRPGGGSRSTTAEASPNGPLHDFVLYFRIVTRGEGASDQSASVVCLSASVIYLSASVLYFRIVTRGECQ